MNSNIKRNRLRDGTDTQIHTLEQTYDRTKHTNGRHTGSCKFRYKNSKQRQLMWLCLCVHICNGQRSVVWCVGRNRKPNCVCLFLGLGFSMCACATRAAWRKNCLCLRIIWRRKTDDEKRREKYEKKIFSRSLAVCVRFDRWLRSCFGVRRFWWFDECELVRVHFGHASKREKMRKMCCVRNRRNAKRNETRRRQKKKKHWNSREATELATLEMNVFTLRRHRRRREFADSRYFNSMTATMIKLHTKIEIQRAKNKKWIGRIRSLKFSSSHFCSIEFELRFRQTQSQQNKTQSERKLKC